MKTRTIEFCRNIVTRLILSIKRFPEAILMAAAAVSVAIFLVHMKPYYDRETEEMLLRTVMVLALGAPVFLSIKVFFERVPALKKGIRSAIYIAASAGLVLYYLFLLKDLEMVSVTRYIAVSIAFYFTFASIPYYYRKENYELYVIKLLTSFFTTYLYSLVLFAGLSALIFTVKALFAVNISEKIYFDILLVVAGVFAPAFFLADIPEHGQELRVEDYPKALKVLLLYIVLPLLLAYSAILYAYFARIIITREWPKGIVSNLVLWYSILSTLIIFLIYPLRVNNRWSKAFTSFFPVLILPLLVMMFISMGKRVIAYGVTESRYFVILVGLWVTGAMLYFIFAKKPRNVVLAASIAVISLLSVIGPWSCYSISKYSQNLRFESILDRNGMIQNGTIVRPTRDLSAQDKREISAIISYFNRYHSLKEIKYLPEGFRVDRMENVFGFKPYEYSDINKMEYFSYNTYETGTVMDIEGFDYFIDFYAYRHDNLKLEGPDGSKGAISLNYDSQGRRFKIFSEGKEIYSGNLEDAAVKIHKERKEKQGGGTEQPVFADENDRVKVIYVFKHIHGWEDKASGVIQINSAECYLFIKLKTAEEAI